MKNLLLVLTLTFSSFSFSQEKIEGINFDQNKAIQILDESIGLEQTCLDEYLTREKHLKKFLIWAPPVTLVGAPTAFLIGGLTGAAISNAAGLYGLGGLGNVVFGAFGGGFGVLGTFIGLETAKAIQFSNMRKMTNLITASHAKLYNSKALIRLTRKYNRKYPQDELNIEDLALKIVMLDETGMLCNGEVRGNLDGKKLKHKLARRRDLIKYINNN